jgi:hypothetical protein
MTVRERVDEPVVNRLMTCGISPRKVSEPDQRLNIVNRLRIRTGGGTRMDTTTLLIIVLLVLLVGGGGWYGRGRWY